MLLFQRSPRSSLDFILLDIFINRASGECAQWWSGEEHPREMLKSVGGLVPHPGEMLEDEEL